MPEIPGESYGYRLQVYDGYVLSLPDETLVHVSDVPGVLALVPAATGGVMQVDKPAFDNVRVEFAPGAVVRDTLVGMGIVFQPPGMPAAAVVSSAIFLAPAEAPVQITVPLTDSGTLKVLQRNAAGRWAELPGAVKVQNRLATYTVSELGISVVVKESAGPGGGGGIGGSGGGSDSRCFIATAAYGTDHPRVETLRRFRDQFLLTNAPGRAFTAAYYRQSPPLAEWVKRSPTLRAAVRTALIPAAAVARPALDPRRLLLPVALILGALGAAGFKKRLGILALALAVSALYAAPARSLDMPHGSGNNMDCSSCHALHRSASGALNKASGIENLCLSCHTSGDPLAGGRAFDLSEQARPGSGGNSHHWSAPAANVSYGTTTAVAPAIATRFDITTTPGTPRLTCANCHDPHKHDSATARPPWDPTAPSVLNQAGRHFMRFANDQNQLCVQCHAAWNMNRTTNALNPAYHYGPYDAASGQQTGAPRFTSGADGNASNDLILSPTGNIQCMSCHGIHQTDSNETTVDPW